MRAAQALSVFAMQITLILTCSLCREAQLTLKFVSCCDKRKYKYMSVSMSPYEFHVHYKSNNLYWEFHRNIYLLNSTFCAATRHDTDITKHLRCKVITLLYVKRYTIHGFKSSEGHVGRSTNFLQANYNVSVQRYNSRHVSVVLLLVERRTNGDLYFNLRYWNTRSSEFLTPAGSHRTKLIDWH